MLCIATQIPKIDFISSSITRVIKQNIYPRVAVIAVLGGKWPPTKARLLRVSQETPSFSGNSEFLRKLRASQETPSFSGNSELLRKLRAFQETPSFSGNSEFLRKLRVSQETPSSKETPSSSGNSKFLRKLQVSQETISNEKSQVRDSKLSTAYKKCV